MGIGSLGQRLYNGEVSFDFVGRKKLWYLISAAILVIAVGSLFVRGLNLGIEFRGGSEFQVPNPTCSIAEARESAAGVVGGEPIVTQTGSGTIRVQVPPIDPAESQQVANALAQTCGVPPGEVDIQLVGPSWGAEITTKAIQALIVFLILVSIFLAIYFEWRMAIAALIALFHDILITVGIYSLTGLEVTPATVVGILTILGYSLYDTVVVFDKVKENTRGITAQSVMTWGEAANLAVNQTLVRSINTSVVALLPVLATIVVGAGLLGAGTLLDLTVALFIGMAAGTYSSIAIATPFLAQLKEQQPEMKALAVRVRGRRASGRGAKADSDDLVATTMEADTARVQPKRTSRAKRGKGR
jgi:preprotein translocase subunit SecF